MSAAGLRASAEDFAARLNRVIVSAVDTAERFGVEHDRSQLRPGRAAAHVHLHANSPELAWIYGTSAQAAPDLHALHFPAGGRRFRPTLEEFLLFLDREKLFTNWKEGWKPKLIQSLEEWERLQARATARQFPDEAAGALEALGYDVAAPSAHANS